MNIDIMNIDDIKVHIICKLTDLIGWSNGGKPVNGLMVSRLPRIHNWLCSKIPPGYDGV